MLSMLDRHAVQALLKAGHAPRQIAHQLGISRRTVQRIALEPPVTTVDEAAAHAARGIGRPGVPDAVQTQVRAWLDAEPAVPPGEVQRRLHEAGTPLGLSTIYRLLGTIRPTMPAEVMVRFEGVAGEFAPFDFGVADVRLAGETATARGRRRVHFAAYRLKWSRFLHVVIVPNERVEALVRALLESFAASGGVPLRVVFDNPKTVVLRREAGRPVWNATLAQAMLDYGCRIELCTPHAPEQKGSVENLVGFVKRAFFTARRFQDLDHDLPQQLTAWLAYANTERPSRATGVPPVARRATEQARWQALAIPPDDYGLHVPVTVGPTAMAAYQGVRYAMPAKACGLPATLHLYPTRVRIVCAGGKHEALHPRFPVLGTVSYLTGQRAQQLAAVYGERKRLYFMRERLVELGPVGEAYVTELVHQRPHTWKGCIARLFAVLEEIGDARFRVVLQRALLQRLIGAEYLDRVLAQVPESLEVAS
jgi:transposase